MVSGQDRTLGAWPDRPRGPFRREVVELEHNGRTAVGPVARPACGRAKPRPAAPTVRIFETDFGRARAPETARETAKLLSFPFSSFSEISLFNELCRRFTTPSPGPFSPRPRSRAAPRAKSFQAEFRAGPAKIKETGLDSLDFSSNSCLFRGLGAVQQSNAKDYRSRRRGSSAPQAKQRSLAAFLHANLAFRPAAHGSSKASIAWISRTKQEFLAGLLAPKARARQARSSWRGQDAAQTDTKGRTRHQ